MDLVFGYLAGLLTLTNPCVLPVIPIALASATTANRLGPFLLATGMSLSFSVLGLLAASIGPALGLSSDVISRAGALVMVAFGVILLVPPLSDRFALATSGIADGAAQRLATADRGGTAGLLLGGILLGAVWAPCIGPTLGGAIALASEGADLAWAGAIMASFSLGVSTVILALAYGARGAIGSRRDRLQRLAEWSKPLMGTVFVAIGLAIYFGLEARLVGALLDVMPVWLQDVSVVL